MISRKIKPICIIHVFCIIWGKEFIFLCLFRDGWVSNMASLIQDGGWRPNLRWRMVAIAEFINRVITPRWRATYDRLASEFPTNSSLAREARKTLAWSSYDPRKLLVNTRTHSQALANARHDVHEYMKLFHTLVKLLASGTSEIRSHVARKFLVSSSYANRDTRMFLVTLVYRSYITRTRLVVHLEGTCRIK